jgi:prefoldin subunit 5
MRRYSTIEEAIERINRAIDALEADIREWNMVKSTLFSHKSGKDSGEEKSLQSEFDSFLNRSVKVRENLMAFRSLFDTISLN